MVSKEKGGDKMEAIVLMTALINLATAILVLIKALKWAQRGQKAPELSFCLFWHFTIKEVNMQGLIITILLLSNAVSFVAILVLLKKIERLKKAKWQAFWIVRFFQTIRKAAF